MINVTFRPKLTVKSLEGMFNGKLGSIDTFKNATLFGRITDLVDQVHPEDEPDSGSRATWLNLYLPVREQDQIFTYKLMVDQSKDGSIYCIQIDYGHNLIFDVIEGSQKIDRRLFDIPRDTATLLPNIKEGGVNALNVPYSQRKGTVKSKYVLDHIISLDERADIKLRYDRYVVNMGELHEVSLNQYIEVAAILVQIIRIPIR